MTSVLRRAAVAACALACAAGSWAVDSSENAALRYWRAWSLADDTAMETVSDADLSASQIPTDVREAAADLQHVVNMLLEAAALPECDFAVDYEKGWEALLPHLSPLRRSAKLLALDAALVAERGNEEAALERINAAYTLPLHIGQERTAISALVAAQMFAIADDTAKRLERSGLLPPEARQRLAATLSRYDAEDPFGILDAVEYESELTVGWMRRTLLDGDRREEAIETLKSVADGVDIASIVRDREALREQLSQLELYYTLAAKAFASDDEAVLLDLERRASEGEFGPLTKAVAPAYSNMRSARNRAQERYDEAAERLGVQR